MVVLFWSPVSSLRSFSKMDGHRGEKCLHVIRHHDFIWAKLDALEVFYEILVVVNVVW